MEGGAVDGPLSKLCPVISTSNQDGRQAKNRKKGDEIFTPSKIQSLQQLLTINNLISIMYILRINAYFIVVNTHSTPIHDR
jgi:hypothetical protein